MISDVSLLDTFNTDHVIQILKREEIVTLFCNKNSIKFQQYNIVYMKRKFSKLLHILYIIIRHLYKSLPY
jgi:hypothetical protein